MKFIESTKLLLLAGIVLCTLTLQAAKKPSKSSRRQQAPQRKRSSQNSFKTQGQIGGHGGSAGGRGTAQQNGPKGIINFEGANRTWGRSAPVVTAADKSGSGNGANGGSGGNGGNAT